MLLKASEVHFFNDMGYRHGPFQHCPDGPDWLSKGKCYCEPRTSFGEFELFIQHCGPLVKFNANHFSASRLELQQLFTKVDGGNEHN